MNELAPSASSAERGYPSTLPPSATTPDCATATGGVDCDPAPSVALPARPTGQQLYEEIHRCCRANGVSIARFVRMAGSVRVHSIRHIKQPRPETVKLCRKIMGTLDTGALPSHPHRGAVHIVPAEKLAERQREGERAAAARVAEIQRVAADEARAAAQNREVARRLSGTASAGVVAAPSRFGQPLPSDTIRACQADYPVLWARCQALGVALELPPGAAMMRALSAGLDVMEDEA